MLLGFLALKDTMNHAGEQLANAQIASALGTHKDTLRKHLRPEKQPNGCPDMTFAAM